MQDRVCGLLKKHKYELFLKCSNSNVDDRRITLNHGESFHNEIQIFRQVSANNGIPGDHLLNKEVAPLRLSWNPKTKGPADSMLLHDLVSMPGVKRCENNNEYYEFYKYFIEQLRLFNALCLGRNYLGIEYVEKQMQFTYEILLQGIIDDKLPWEMREHFCRLMTSLHIDRQPYVLVTYPNLTRLADEKATRDMDNRNGNNQFVLLQCFILQHLRDFEFSKNGVRDQMEFMRFLSSLVDALLTLVQLDFFSRPKMLLEFMEPLLKCLDGTGDISEVGGRRSSLGRAPTMRSRKQMAMKRRRANNKVAPEGSLGSLASQKHTPRQNVNEDEDDDSGDEGKGCIEKLKLKTTTSFQRVDIFINSTPYMIVMTVFVFVATINGFVPVTLGIIHNTLSALNLSLSISISLFMCISLRVCLCPFVPLLVLRLHNLRLPSLACCSFISVFMAYAERPLTDVQNALLAFEAVADTVFVILFLMDVVLRILVMGFVEYVHDALCFLDLVVSSIDILFFCLNLFDEYTGSEPSAANTGNGVSSTSQVLRLFRVFRIIRITKAIRAAKQLLARKSTLVLGLPTPTVTTRFEADEFTNTITDFKLGIMKVLQAFLLQAMDFQLSYVVLSRDWKHVESKMQNKEINLMAIADKTTKNLDLDKLLIDLIMYKRPEMSEAALNLLFCLHFEECSLFNLFHQTQLIDGRQKIAKVKTVRADVRNLQNLIETFEVWIRETDNFKANTDTLCHYFHELASICHESAPMQDVLRDSGAMRAIEQCLRDILPPEEDEVQVQPVSQSV